MTDLYSDPYDSTVYQTPIKKVATNEKNNDITNGRTTQTKIFNPYQKPVEEEKPKKESEVPEKIDLTKNAYEQNNKGKPEDEGIEVELRLLDELGISPGNILQKLISVLTFHRIDKHILEDSDMAGPFLILIMFAFSLVLQAKSNFGYLYGLSVFGGCTIFLLMNLMSSKESILLYSTISVLGYCMLPVVILSFFSVFIPMKSAIGAGLCLLGILLSSLSATRFFEIALSMKEQKWLIFYPLVLFYTCFVFFTIF